MSPSGRRDKHLVINLVDSEGNVVSSQDVTVDLGFTDLVEQAPVKSPLGITVASRSKRPVIDLTPDKSSKKLAATRIGKLRSGVAADIEHLRRLSS